MVEKPAECMRNDLLQRAGLLEKVAGARNDHKPLLTGESRQRLTIEINHDVIRAADDQQRRRLYFRQNSGRKIRPAAARHDGGYVPSRSSSRDQGGRRPGACPETADRQ